MVNHTHDHIRTAVEDAAREAMSSCYCLSDNKIDSSFNYLMLPLYQTYTFFITVTTVACSERVAVFPALTPKP